MASKLNELKQKALDARKASLKAQAALDGLLDGEAAAKASYKDALNKQAANPVKEEAPKFEKAVAEASASADSFPSRIAAQRKLMQIADADVLEAEQAYETEKESMATKVADAPGDGLEAEEIEVGHDNRQDKPWRSLGEQLVAVHRAAVTPHLTDPRLLKGLSPKAAASGLGEQVASDGGFLVQKQSTTTILEKTYEIGALLNRVFKLPITVGNGTKIPAIDETSRATGSRWGGVQAYWVAEGVAPTATKPKIRQIELELRKVAALVYSTDELNVDAPQLEALVMKVLPEELSFAVEDAIVNGTGSGQPLGYTATGAVVSVAKEAGQAATSIVFENVVKMWSRMWARSRANAVWLINQDAEPQLFALSKVVGTGGIPVYLPANGLAGQPNATLFGRPVLPVEYCATLGTVGDIQLVDLSQYILIDKGGIRADSSMHVKFETDQMTYRFIYRVDGQPTWNAALTPKNGTNTLSPFVVLATRA